MMNAARQALLAVKELTKELKRMEDDRLYEDQLEELGYPEPPEVDDEDASELIALEQTNTGMFDDCYA